MYKFIFLTFAFLAWAFYEMSGGADFQPTQPVAQITPVQTAPAQVEEPRAVAAVPTTAATAPEITRAAYTAPSYRLGTPAQEELDAVDPAVLASFADVLNRQEAETETETPGVEIASVDDSLVADQIAGDLREVTGNRVNMRNGPGTDYSVVGKLERGDAVEVLAEPGNGWLKLRVSDTGRIGWMADFLVSSAD